MLGRLSVLVLGAFLLGAAGCRQGYFARASERRSQLQLLALTGLCLGLAVGLAALILAPEPTQARSLLSELEAALQPPAAVLQAVGYAAGLFRELGRCSHYTEKFTQPSAAYVSSFHSRNGSSVERMDPAQLASFDAALEALVRSFGPDGQVCCNVRSTLIWGTPNRG